MDANSSCKHAGPTGFAALHLGALGGDRVVNVGKDLPCNPILVWDRFGLAIVTHHAFLSLNHVFVVWRHTDGLAVS